MSFNISFTVSFLCILVILCLTEAGKTQQQRKICLNSYICMYTHKLFNVQSPAHGALFTSSHRRAEKDTKDIMP